MLCFFFRIRVIEFRCRCAAPRRMRKREGELYFVMYHEKPRKRVGEAIKGDECGREGVIC